LGSWEEKELKEMPEAPHGIKETLKLIGPMAVLVGFTLGGGEAVYMPYVASTGHVEVFWLLTCGTIAQTIIMYEVLRYTLATGQSVLYATRYLRPRNLWPILYAIMIGLFAIWPGYVISAAAAILPVIPGADYMLLGYASFVIALLILAFSKYVMRVIEVIFTGIQVYVLATVILLMPFIVTAEGLLATLYGFFNFGLAGISSETVKLLGLSVLAALFQQPAGGFPLLLISDWAREKGMGLTKYAGKVTGFLAPPEDIEAEGFRFDTKDPVQMNRFRGWMKTSKIYLVIFFAIITSFLFPFLIVAGAYSQLYKRGIVAGGLEVVRQIAMIFGLVFGPALYTVFLLVVFLNYYDAIFGTLDVFGRVTATAAWLSKSARKWAFRNWYWLAVLIAFGIGLPLIPAKQPFEMGLIMGIFCVLVNIVLPIHLVQLNAKLPKEIRHGKATDIVLIIIAIAYVIDLIVWAIGMM
jgi:hypothetical protein